MHTHLFLDMLISANVLLKMYILIKPRGGMTAGGPRKGDSDMEIDLSSPSGGRTIRSNFSSQAISVLTNYIYSLDKPFFNLQNRITVPLL